MIRELTVDEVYKMLRKDGRSIELLVRDCKSEPWRKQDIAWVSPIRKNGFGSMARPWKYAAIEETKERYMTTEECIAWACTEGSSGWQASSPVGNWVQPTVWSYTAGVKGYKRRTVDWNNGKPIYGEPQEFKIEE